MPKKTQKSKVGILFVFATLMLVLPILAQSNRGKTELNSPGGKITVDYGRPQLKGRDPLTWQEDGIYWRMGMDSMTTITTPVDLVFGAKKVPKGKYGLWLLKVSAERYELVFNSVTEGMGMSHEKAKDVASAPAKKEKATAPAESFTLELKGAPKGGSLLLTWGTTRLTSDFEFGK
jgi:hypothetical protein